MRNAKMRDIVSRGTLLTEYALTNPSQPNYIGLISGDLLGVSGDDDYYLSENNLVDLMEAKNVSWKAYQEHYPGNCFAKNTADHLYMRKHNPFISFNNIRNNPKRCANIVDASTLIKDLEANTVPQYSFYTPNMNNNGHDTGMDYTADWLYDTFLPNYLIPFNSTGNSLLVITFDEGVPGDNRIFTLLIGKMIPPGYVDSTSYTHYSLLRLIEDNYKLGSLNRHDTRALQITCKNFVDGQYVDLGRHGAETIIAIIALPIVALLIVGVLAYYLYMRRRRQQQGTKQVRYAELGLLDDDE